MNDQSVHCAWEKFVEHGIGSAHVRNIVLDSWQRSRRHHVRIDLPLATTLSEGELYRKRQAGLGLLKVSRQALEQARHLLADSDSMMMLTDASGTVLETAGDPSTVARGNEIGLRCGGVWDETVIGTNAIGTALANDAPVQIHASEHFCSNVQRWTCAAAPIHHPLSRKVLGVVDLSGRQHTYNPQNLAHAVALAQQVESALQHEIDAENAAMLRHFLTRRGQWHQDGLIAVAQGGRIVHATETALKALGKIDRHLIGDGCIAALGERDPANWPDILHAILPRAELEPVTEHGHQIGALIVLPQHEQHRPRSIPFHARTVMASGVGHSMTAPAREASAFNAIIGDSPAIRQACHIARRMADSGAAVLIEGETGVGKELFARAIHQRWAADGPFVPVNCGGLPRELIGSELFGYARGAFTGADSQGRAGKLEAAEGGTLCLDEIGEMPLDIQPYLLRVLEDGTVYRIGSHQPRQVQIHLVCITNRDLALEARAGRFRSDLYYRIAVLRLNIPPLRERGDDAVLLAEHFMRKVGSHNGAPPPRFSPAALDLVRVHPWPGNVRELRNVVQMLVFMAADEPGGRVIEPEHLHQVLSRHGGFAAAPPASVLLSASAQTAASPKDLRHLQHEAMLAALHAHHGNVSKAARALGIARSTLYARLRAP